MSSKRALRRRRWRRCPDKDTYLDEVVAQAAVARARSRTGQHLSWYRCPRCGSLHLGHTPAALAGGPAR